MELHLLFTSKISWRTMSGQHLKTLSSRAIRLHKTMIQWLKESKIKFFSGVACQCLNLNLIDILCLEQPVHAGILSELNSFCKGKWAIQSYPDSIQPSAISTYPCRIAGGLVSISSGHWVKSEGQPGQIASPLQGNVERHRTNNHANTHSHLKTI